MTLSVYLEYKNSGVPWLGDVPVHWQVAALRGLANPGRGSFIDGDWIESPFITDSGVRLLQTGNIGVGTYKEQGFRYVSEKTFIELKCTEIHPGDVLICRLADPVGRACLAPSLSERMITSVDVCILKPSMKFDNRYVVYLLSSANYLSYMEGQCRGGTRDRVSRSFLGTVRVPIFPLPEQSAIATFLDRETAKIDSLISEQEKLITLLAEKRQATISHAVTKGLNPNVPMKDSGVEWLGDVPEHWKIVPLRWYVSCSSGDGITSERIGALSEENSIPAIGGNGLMGYTDISNISQVVIVVGRVGALCGNVHRVSPPAWISDNALVLKVSNKINLEYFEFALRSRNLNKIASRTAQPLITGTQVCEQRVPLPPLDEQVSVVAFIKREISQVDALVCEAARGISLLKERRSALISAAVTGKIDVRQAVKQEQITIQEAA